MFFVDKEKRSQNYCCAADVEQASNNFRHCQYMIENNPKLISRLREKRVFRSTRSFEHNDGAIYKVLSSIADTKHGLSPNFVYVDEVHAHPNSELIDVMLTGTAARTQPLVLYTTTADYDRPSVCNSLYDKAKAIASDKQWEPRLSFREGMAESQP
jgi:phage terminase large subunit-like protein